MGTGIAEACAKTGLDDRPNFRCDTTELQLGFTLKVGLVPNDRECCPVVGLVAADDHQGAGKLIQT
ncbi:MAG: hypothetical protein M3526_05960 [Actinomycetota bacterium]|nr:hypothetical protein [Actinomycetota bacterium]